MRQVNGSGHQRLFFDSGYAPHRDEPGRDRWLGYTANDREYALMLRHRRPRPWLVCVHGTEMGRPALDLTVFRVRHLHRDLGLNVVLPALPMHGPRGYVASLVASLEDDLARDRGRTGGRPRGSPRPPRGPQQR